MLKENEVAKTIADVAFPIHRQLGPGLLESDYPAIGLFESKRRRPHAKPRSREKEKTQTEKSVLATIVPEVK